MANDLIEQMIKVCKGRKDQESGSSVHHLLHTFSSSWCYKTLFGGNLEILDFPLSQNSKKSAILREINSSKALFSHFWAGSDIRNKLYSISWLWGNLDFLQIKFYNINYRTKFISDVRRRRLLQLFNYKKICLFFVYFRQF